MAALTNQQDHDLPDVIGLSQAEINQYYPLWLLWKATEKRHLPSALLAEPAEPLAALLEIESYFNKIEEMTRKAESKEPLE